MVAAGLISAGGFSLIPGAWDAAEVRASRASGALVGLLPRLARKLIHPVDQIVDILTGGGLRLGEEPLKHAFLEALDIAVATVEFHGVKGVDRRAEGGEQPRRQA